MRDATFEYELGVHAGRTYLLTARATPGFDDPEEFAVVVHFNDPDTDEEVRSRVSIPHGYVHFDRVYRRDEPKDELAVGFWAASNCSKTTGGRLPVSTIAEMTSHTR